MGTYLNPGVDRYEEALRSQIYVDKSGLLSCVNQMIGTMQKYICVSRPRRFGKSVTADMVSAYYDRTVDGHSVFPDHLISKTDSYEEHMNQYDVLKINMQDFLGSAGPEEFISRLQKRLLWELMQAYPDTDYFDSTNLIRSMNDLYTQKKCRFVIIIDEWDCIFREYPHDERAQKKYLDFLRDWLKDKPYVALAYMTGILPIKKYGTHSALNMFTEYSMENPGILSKYVGFTEEEVSGLCERYHMDLQECNSWYDGYLFHGMHVYNPDSIVKTMLSGIYDDYWNQTETYEALKVYIDMNYDGLRDSIIRMMAGDHVRINTGSFQNDMTTFSNADDVMTLLVHLGYLGYSMEDGTAFIPNHEIMKEFVTATTASNPWNEVIHSLKYSDEFLKAAWNQDEEAVAEGIAKAHLETSHLQYNDENALSYTVSLAYYAARQYYTVVRELPTGKGFADLAFIPRKKYADKPAMLVELKWDQSASTAISQIHEKQYPEGLKEYAGNLLLVGISYDKETRQHQCVIEKLLFTPLVKNGIAK